MKLFPAIQGSVGSWRYYSTKMSAVDLASQVRFASEVYESKALDHWIQRTLNESRAKNDIAEYLARHDDRFFNSIVVAAIEGNPTFFSVSIADDPAFRLIADKKMEDSFGILRFDGSQKYYALDGQHRLKAIKSLIDNESSVIAPQGFEDEEFSVIIVVQRADEDREEFMTKYRRLFSHLNRHAKPMDKATTIIMEEDDAFAILTRRLIQEHPFFSWFEGESTRVRCEKSENMSVNEPYFTNIISLYKMTIELLSAPARINDDGWGKGGKVFQRLRPTDEELDRLYEELKACWDVILEILPALKEEPRVMRNNIDKDSVNEEETITNHLFFRPLGQNLLAELVRGLMNNSPDPLNFSEDNIRNSITSISKIDWRLSSPPWRHLLFVYDGELDRWKMRNEDRKEAERIALRVAKWLSGCDPYGTEEELIGSVKSPWRNLLLNVSDVDADKMWDEILEFKINLDD